LQRKKVQRRRIIFDDDINEKLLAKQDEMKKYVPSASYSRAVNNCLKEYFNGENKE